MAFDLKQYRKVHHTPHHSIFRHPDGHEIKVLHDKLDPSLKAEVMKLPKRNAPKAEPQGYAKGGEVQGALTGLNAINAADPSFESGISEPNYLEAGLQNRSPMSRVETPHEPSFMERLTTPIPGASHSEGFNMHPDATYAQDGSIGHSAGSPDVVQQMAPEAPAPAPQNPQLGLQSGLGQPAASQGEDPYTTGIAEQKRGVNAEAKALGAQGKADALTLGTAETDQAKLAKDTQAQFEALSREREGLMRDLADGHIDPNHFMGSMDTSSKVTTAIGLILGGMGGGLTGQGNPVQAFLDKQIDRDIQAQQANLNKKESLLSANLKQFGNLRDATEMTRVMMMDGVKLSLQKAAAQAQDPIAKARALQAAGTIDQNSAGTLSQLAARKALMSSNGANPERIIQLMVPPARQKEVTEQLKQAQDRKASGEEALKAFDKLNAQMLGGALSPNAKESLTDPIAVSLARDEAGRVNEFEFKAFKSLFPAALDSESTRATKREQFVKLVNKKMHFPALGEFGIPTPQILVPAPNTNAPKKK